ncbi:MAG: hypothetical protein WBH03_07275 [Cyclobacteriaceae bacterium]
MGISIKRIIWSLLFSFSLFGTMGSMKQEAGVYSRITVVHEPDSKSKPSRTTPDKYLLVKPLKDSRIQARASIPY